MDNIKRMVVKVGTSTLTYENGKLNLGRIDKLARTIADIKNRGIEVVLVSSGAIGVGIGKLGLKERPTLTREKQAAAAVGQCELMYLYDKMFSEYGYKTGQVLLTRDVIDIPERNAAVFAALVYPVDLHSGQRNDRLCPCSLVLWAVRIRLTDRLINGVFLCPLCTVQCLCRCTE